MTDITLRRATAADATAIAAFIGPFVDEGKLLPRTYDELAELLPNFFVAEADGKLVGCAALEVYSRKLAEIRSLAVAPEIQGQGVGKLLVQACLQLAQERGVLEVMAITSSVQFFKACGFDFTLPGEKQAVFYQVGRDDNR